MANVVEEELSDLIYLYDEVNNLYLTTRNVHSAFPDVENCLTIIRNNLNESLSNCEDAISIVESRKE